MNFKTLNGFLTIGVVVLAVIFGIKYLSKNQAPTITVDESVVINFTEGDREETLLKGVTAEDPEDGDITSDIFVVSVIDAKDNAHAVVTYGVKDSANNTTTAKRTVNFQGTGGTAISIEVYNAEEIAAREKLGITTITNPYDGDETANSDTASSTTSTTNPSITLSSNKLVLSVGDSFNPLSLISDYSDDVDTADYLSKHVSYDGTYNMNAAGTYVITLYVTDSQGNVSDRQEVTLVVSDN